MKKTSVKMVVIAFAILAILISIPLSTYAYATLVFRHRNPNIYYYYDNWTDPRGVSFFSSGASAWRAKTTEAQILHYSNNPGSGFNVYMSVGNISEVTWDGVTNTNYSTSYPYYVNSQTVTINRAYTSTWNNDGALQSVVVHEMGHVFGLADYGNSRTIMNGYTFGTNSRYGTYGLTVPQADDVNGVNAKY